MTAHRIHYEGPPNLAVQAATLLADAPGVELTSAGRPEPVDGLVDTVRLDMTVEGDDEAVTAAVTAIGERLPVGSQLAVGRSEDLPPA